MKLPDRIAAGPILLRRITSADVDALLVTINESLDHLRPWMPWARALNNRAEVADFVARAENGWQEGTEFHYLIWSRNERELVGGCGLHARIGAGALEIGYWVAHKHVRRGYATGAARALTKAALNLPTLTRVEIHCDEANLHSAAVAKAVGYRFDRFQDKEIQTPAETGRQMVWVLSRGIGAGLIRNYWTNTQLEDARARANTTVSIDGATWAIAAASHDSWIGAADKAGLSTGGIIDRNEPCDLAIGAARSKLPF